MKRLNLSPRRKKQLLRAAIIIAAAALATVAVWFVRSGRWRRLRAHLERSNTAILEGVSEFSQYPDYPSGGEAVSLCILLRYYGLDLTPDDIIAEIPVGPLPYEDGGSFYGGNPEREFVGSPYSEGGCGVLNRPIADAAEAFKSGAVTTAGASVADIMEIIDGGNPVMVWYSSGTELLPGQRVSWLDCETGEEILRPSGVCTAVIYGHDGMRSFYLSDPITGTKRLLDVDQFDTAFRLTGGRLVFYGGKP